MRGSKSAELINAISSFCGLQSLRLGWNVLGGSCAGLGVALAANSTLTHLDLSNCKIGPDEGLAMAHGLERNTSIKHLILDLNPLCQAVAVLHPILLRRSLQPDHAITFSLKNVSWDPSVDAGLQSPVIASTQATAQRKAQGDVGAEPALAGRYRLDLGREADRRKLARLVELADHHGPDCWRNAAITHMEWPLATSSPASSSRGDDGATMHTRKVWYAEDSIAESLAFPRVAGAGAGEGDGQEAQGQAAGEVARQTDSKAKGKGGINKGQAARKVRSEADFPKMGIFTVDIITPPLHRACASGEGGAGGKAEDAEVFMEGEEWKAFSQLTRQLCSSTDSRSQVALLHLLPAHDLFTCDQAVVLYSLLCDPKASCLAMETIRGDVLPPAAAARRLDIFVMLCSRLCDEEVRDTWPP